MPTDAARATASKPRARPPVPKDPEQRETVANPDAIPAELTTRAQWLVWRYEWKKDHQPGDKPTKVPYQARAALNGRRRKAKSTDPDTWATFAEALEAYRNNPGMYSGVGFAITEDDPLAGVDLDNAVDPETGELVAWAADIVAKLRTYAEVSPSGEGVRLFALGSLAGLTGRKRGDVEMYDAGRYLTVTGAHLEGTPEALEERDAELASVHAEHIAPPPAPEPKPSGNGKAHHIGVTLTDAEVLEAAYRSRNGDRIRALYDGDTSAHSGDHSAADLALVGHLAFFADYDRAAVDRLFRASRLFREKWDERHHGDGRTYGEGTLDRATEGKRPGDGYSRRRPEPADDSRNLEEAPAPQHQLSKAPAPRVTVNEPPLPAAPDLAMIHFRLSDLGNAERFAHRHGDHVRHVEGLGWHYFDGRRWALDTSGHVQRLAAKTIRELYGLLEYVQDTKEREQLFKHAMRSESGKALDLMLEKARAGQSHRILNARADQLDADPDLLNVLNGTIHLPSGELRPHNPADLITKLAPVEYRPDAAAPTWEAFQRRISGDDDELIAFKRRAYGYTATGHTREQVLMIAFGTGANGKTTELEAIAARLGDYAATAAFDTFAGSRDAKSQRFGLARLPGARFVRASEGDDGVRLSEGTVKAVTGDEVIVAEHKMRAPFEYRPRFALWLSSNHKPVTRGTDHGLWRRIRLVPYPVTIPDAERDHRLLEKLAAEAPGILAWIVAGAREWYAHGLGTAAAVEAATDEYRAEMDRLATFLAVGIEANTIHSTASSDLHAAFRGWCKDNGERPMTQSSFTQAMLERGHEKKRTGAGVVWIGLHLTPEGRQWAEKARQDGNRSQ